MTLTRREQNQPLCHAPLAVGKSGVRAVCHLDAGHRSRSHFGPDQSGRWQSWTTV